MKKLIALISACSLIVCGCSGTDESHTNESSLLEDAPANITTEGIKIESYTSLSNTVHGWGQGKQFDEMNIPTSCIDFQQKYGKYNASFIKENCGNTIYLTFDEGYENGYTSAILDVLKEKNVPAVFFVTGDYVETSPELVERMIQEGHAVGNHTVTHPSMPLLSEEEMASEINELDSLVDEQFGYHMNLFRPPKGEFSEESLAVTQAQGYQSVFWSFAYSDWDINDQPNSSEALKILTERLHPGGIYLLHAVSSTNAEVLEEFIDYARSVGYEFRLLT